MQPDMGPHVSPSQFSGSWLRYIPPESIIACSIHRGRRSVRITSFCIRDSWSIFKANAFAHCYEPARLRV